jgi:hypothetical protein
LKKKNVVAVYIRTVAGGGFFFIFPGFGEREARFLILKIGWCFWIFE